MIIQIIIYEHNIYYIIAHKILYGNKIQIK